MADTKDIKPRTLMGPGPSDVNPRVLEAMARPTIGHLDGQFLEILNDIRDMLQAIFQTKNKLTLAVSGTGSAGMETCVVNLIEPGDKMLVCVNGVFGKRMTDVAERAGAEVATIDVPWGRVFTAEQVERAMKRSGPFKVVGIVHAETSTGAAQPIEPISRVVHEAGALLLVDTVTSLGGMEVDVDGWQIDACYSGTQKCLSCPPGLAPVSFSSAAEEVLSNRKTKVRSWYLDMNMVRKYWGSERLYHHTAPINMNYALHEALRIVLEEGLEPRWKRHLAQHRALKAGLEEMGISYIADPAHQLPMLNAVMAPDGVDEAVVRKRLLSDYAIEIGGGLGDFKGKAWRIGLMGESATERHVNAVLTALKEVLAQT
ncbi:MAG: alanine--glyoxylate aminotransferase family protein [Planctomycetes bacterium]|jgi:alanine-glyoxylate transaminase/serine-glyoxylate transaminase/serine-pyruvate transaminase|nr:alanine--glyoxylate aminotransferase family protein [Planctomycetota bacterium]